MIFAIFGFIRFKTVARILLDEVYQLALPKPEDQRNYRDDIQIRIRMIHDLTPMRKWRWVEQQLREIAARFPDDEFYTGNVMHALQCFLVNSDIKRTVGKA